MADAPRLADMIDKVRTQRAAISKDFGIEILGIGGSVARDDANLSSDIDLGVRKNRPISLFEVVEAQEALSENLGLAVDLVFVDYLPAFKSGIFMRDLVRL
jgi:predicted nucleotidyltransferase